MALRRVEATAAGLGKKKTERRSRSLVRSLSRLREIEINRQLLARLREMERLTESAAEVLNSRWDAEYSEGLETALGVARGRKRRRLERRLGWLARRGADDAIPRLERESRRIERRLLPPDPGATDRRLHRYRIAVKRARYLAEDLSACGIPGLEVRIAREKELQDSLGRWNDVRLFRERLEQIREESEEKGSVTLVLELDHLIAALEGTVASARRDALAAAARFARVIPFLERSA